ncbi:hypothetical protein Bealeia1_02018 (plasmid) [Candidatus Bealeia paramacronuclearis]|uniref:Uncharacterized protein n=1 Tax=Candidatus Bealeia paramacronuclearis TaxID=1921001 RepID=A0ABZ2CC24_9PROT|nr:hypothetical protein [Candidatus Bealeia paramacronuclearis]
MQNKYNNIFQQKVAGDVMCVASEAFSHFSKTHSILNLNLEENKNARNTVTSDRF